MTERAAAGDERRRERRSAERRPVPVIHGAHWKWLVIVYFFLGGISGAAAAIGGIERFARPAGSRPVARAARHVAMLAFLPCPVLLILDLGRPSRFLMMLRVLKLRSPMSFGTWALVVFGGVVAAASARQAATDGLLPGRRVRRAALAIPEPALDVAAVAGGVAVLGYTGVLLSATAVPLWARRPALLGGLFVSSAFATGAAAIGAARSLASGGMHEHDIERLKQIASLVEIALLFAWLRQLGEFSGPLTKGSNGRRVRHGVAGAGLALPMALNAWGLSREGRSAWAASWLSALLTMAGGFVLRHAIVTGGRDSADDPVATFAYTRSTVTQPFE
jgi:formate-dependent nitrite reductase membrane component NrfD